MTDSYSNEYMYTYTYTYIHLFFSLQIATEI